jgi:hypothetical protein
MDEKIVQVIVPIVVGALVAGLSALAKTAYERRDERLMAHRQLELASKRTAFVSEWLEVCRSAATDDVEFAASATVRARAELEEAYEEAQQALSKGRSAVTHSGSKTPGQQLGSALMLGRRRRALSYVAVATFYFVVGSLFLLPTFPEEAKLIDGEPNPDYMSRWSFLLLAIVSTIVLRFVVGAIVQWLEDRGAAHDAAPTGAEPAIPPVVSFPVTEAEPHVEGAR